MSDLRTAAQQALEALTNCNSEHGHRCNRCDSEVDEGGKVVAALRAALAQQAEPVHDRHGACPTHCCPVHGCKYMHDDCPVVSGAVQPVYPRNNGCESCADDALAQQAEPGAYGYASRLAFAIWKKHYKDIAPQWKPLDDLMGVLTQIDNMTSGLTLLAQQAEPVAWECKAGGLKPLTQRQYDAQTANIRRHYTRIAPPQRKPLTEEEMYSVEEEARKSFRQSQRGVRGQQITYWDGLTPWLIRAVERAHGIKE